MSKPDIYDYTAWLLAVPGFLPVLYLHLLPALIAGLLVVELVRALLPFFALHLSCLLYTSPSPRDGLLSRMPSSA